MSVQSAVRATVDGFKGGAKAVAIALEMNYQVLLNKLNPNNTTHHLSLAEAVEIMRVTKDTRILEALAGEFGGMFLQLSVDASNLPTNLVTDLAEMSGNFGTLMREVAEDLADGVITEKEITKVEAEAYRLNKAVAVLVNDLRRMKESNRRAA